MTHNESGIECWYLVTGQKNMHILSLDVIIIYYYQSKCCFWAGRQRGANGIAYVCVCVCVSVCVFVCLLVCNLHPLAHAVCRVATGQSCGWHTYTNWQRASITIKSIPIGLCVFARNLHLLDHGNIVRAWQNWEPGWESERANERELCPWYGALRVCFQVKLEWLNHLKKKAPCNTNSIQIQFNPTNLLRMCLLCTGLISPAEARARSVLLLLLYTLEFEVKS